jgi:peptidoglycan/xylan/chitin deacetylase (PgdA/CDA1 family)
MHALLLVVLAAKAQPAWTDRAAWPQPVTNEAGFDRASRAEVLVFVEAMSAALSDPAALLRESGVKHGDLDALERWRQARATVLRANFTKAMATCTGSDVLCPAKPPETFDALTVQATPMLETLPAPYAAWLSDARRFHALYVRELARLALLSSRLSSEVALLDPSELDGESLPDRAFVLTFDDGPTGAAQDTDKTLEVLRAHDLNAIFFVVGDAVHARRPKAALYDEQCVGSHGASHQSHTAVPAVAAKLEAWNEELAALTGKVRWFRPPFGQRSLAQTQALAARGTSVMLWNIDSQDWQAPADRALVRGRVETLMFLWRRGVVLFHDVHPVAREVLPTLVRETGGMFWVDCRQL